MGNGKKCKRIVWWKEVWQPVIKRQKKDVWKPTEKRRGLKTVYIRAKRK